MGGSLGGIFSGQPAGPNDQPSALQKLVQGTAKSAGTSFGRGMQQQPQQMGGGPIQPPTATPVDPSFFAPMVFPQG